MIHRYLVLIFLLFVLCGTSSRPQYAVSALELAATTVSEVDREFRDDVTITNVGLESVSFTRCIFYKSVTVTVASGRQPTFTVVGSVFYQLTIQSKATGPKLNDGTGVKLTASDTTSDLGYLSMTGGSISASAFRATSLVFVAVDIRSTSIQSGNATLPGTLSISDCAIAEQSSLSFQNAASLSAAVNVQTSIFSSGSMLTIAHLSGLGYPMLFRTSTFVDSTLVLHNLTSSTALLSGPHRVQIISGSSFTASTLIISKCKLDAWAAESFVFAVYISGSSFHTTSNVSIVDNHIHAHTNNAASSVARGIFFETVAFHASVLMSIVRNRIYGSGSGSRYGLTLQASKYGGSTIQMELSDNYFESATQSLEISLANLQNPQLTFDRNFAAKPILLSDINATSLALVWRGDAPGSFALKGIAAECPRGPRCPWLKLRLVGEIETLSMSNLAVIDSPLKASNVSGTFVLQPVNCVFLRSPVTMQNAKSTEAPFAEFSQCDFLNGSTLTLSNLTQARLISGVRSTLAVSGCRFGAQSHLVVTGCNLFGWSGGSTPNNGLWVSSTSFSGGSNLSVTNNSFSTQTNNDQTAASTCVTFSSLTLRDGDSTSIEFIGNTFVSVGGSGKEYGVRIYETNFQNGTLDVFMITGNHFQHGAGAFEITVGGWLRPVFRITDNVAVAGATFTVSSINVSTLLFAPTGGSSISLVLSGAIGCPANPFCVPLSKFTPGNNISSLSLQNLVVADSTFEPFPVSFYRVTLLRTHTTTINHPGIGTVRDCTLINSSLSIRQLQFQAPVATDALTMSNVALRHSVLQITDSVISIYSAGSAVAMRFSSFTLSEHAEILVANVSLELGTNNAITTGAYGFLISQFVMMDDCSVLRMVRNTIGAHIARGVGSGSLRPIYVEGYKGGGSIQFANNTIYTDNSASKYPIELAMDAAAGKAVVRLDFSYNEIEEKMFTVTNANGVNFTINITGEEHQRTAAMFTGSTNLCQDTPCTPARINLIGSPLAAVYLRWLTLSDSNIVVSPTLTTLQLSIAPLAVLDSFLFDSLITYDGNMISNTLPTTLARTVATRTVVTLSRVNCTFLSSLLSLITLNAWTLENSTFSIRDSRLVLKKADDVLVPFSASSHLKTGTILEFINNTITFDVPGVFLRLTKGMPTVFAQIRIVDSRFSHSSLTRPPASSPTTILFQDLGTTGDQTIRYDLSFNFSSNVVDLLDEADRVASVTRTLSSGSAFRLSRNVFRHRFGLYVPSLTSGALIVTDNTFEAALAVNAINVQGASLAVLGRNKLLSTGSLAAALNLSSLESATKYSFCNTREGGAVDTIDTFDVLSTSCAAYDGCLVAEPPLTIDVDGNPRVCPPATTEPTHTELSRLEKPATTRECGPALTSWHPVYGVGKVALIVPISNPSTTPPKVADSSTTANATPGADDTTGAEGGITNTLPINLLTTSFDSTDDGSTKAKADNTSNLSTKSAEDKITQVPRGNTSSSVENSSLLRGSRTLTFSFRPRNNRTDDISPFAPNTGSSSSSSSKLLQSTTSISPSAAQAIVATGIGTTAFAGVLSPASANKANNAGRMMQAIQCEFADDDDDLLDPPWYQFVLPVPLGAEEALAKAFGAIVFTTIVILASGIGVVLVVRLRGTPKGGATDEVAGTANQRQYVKTTPGRMSRLVGIAFALCLSFYAPNVVSLGTTLAVHANMGLTRFVGAICVVLCFISLAAAVYFVSRMSTAECNALKAAIETIPVSDAPPETENSNQSNQDMMKRDDESKTAPTPLPSSAEKSSFGLSHLTLLTLFDATRDVSVTHLRLLVLEDILAAFLLGFIAGVRPEDSHQCSFVAIGQLIVAFLHLLYVGAFRPYDAGLEQFFATGIAALQVVLCAVCLAVTLGMSSTPFLATVGWLLIAMNASFYIQLIVLTVYEILQRHRAKKALQESALAAPLLLLADSSHDMVDGTASSMKPGGFAGALVRPLNPLLENGGGGGGGDIDDTV